MDSELTPDRRRLFRKLLALAGLGITGALVSHGKVGLLPRVQGTPGGTSGTALIIDGSPANSGTGTTELDSSIASGAALLAFATAGSGTIVGVQGRSNSPNGTGLYGWASAGSGSNFGVAGYSSSTSG